MDWISLADRLPEERIEVKTKIDDGRGVRNEQTLVYEIGLWWFPDRSMYVYYTPTHWMPIESPAR